MYYSCFLIIPKFGSNHIGEGGNELLQGIDSQVTQLVKGKKEQRVLANGHPV